MTHFLLLFHYTIIICEYNHGVCCFLRDRGKMTGPRPAPPKDSDRTSNIEHGTEIALNSKSDYHDDESIAKFMIGTVYWYSTKDFEGPKLLDMMEYEHLLNQV